MTARGLEINLPAHITNTTFLKEHLMLSGYPEMRDFLISIGVR